MKTRTIYMNTLAALLFLLLCSAFFNSNASAQWWRFGTDDTEPVFTDLLFNQISALNVDQSMNFTLEDLDSNKVIVRGRAEVGQGSIGRVEASLDAGTSWIDIPFNDRGMFAFEFSPEIERTYNFRIRALSTTGQSSDDMMHSFNFRVVRTDLRAEARQVFEELLSRYMNRDRSGFMQLVSRDFTGSEMALDSALSNDFRFFDSIRIRPTIQRMAEFDGRWTIYFSFNRQVRAVRSGELLQDQANTSLTLIREGEGYRLYEMAAPLIFGLSDPTNVATFVTDESIGKEVISVDREGNVDKTEQGQTTDSTTGPASNIREGSVSLSVWQGYSFFSRKTSNNIGVVSFQHEGNILFWGDETQEFKELHGYSSLTAITSVSDDGWQSAVSESDDAVIGKIYALKLIDGTYAIIRIAGGTDTGGGWLNPATYQYRHQLNGTPRFK